MTRSAIWYCSNETATVLFHLFYAMVENHMIPVSIRSFCSSLRHILIRKKGTNMLNSKRCWGLVSRHISHFVPSLIPHIIIPFSTPRRLVIILALLLCHQFACRECQWILDPSDRYIFISPNYQSKGFLSYLSVTAL